MIYLKDNGDSGVTLAGEVINEAMIEQGYIEYNGPIPKVTKYQYLMLVDGVLTVIDDVEYYAEDVSKMIQEMLDDKARELRYNNMISARAVAGIPITGGETVAEKQIHDEAIKLATWYLRTWGKALEIEQQVLDKTISRPSIDELKTLLPKYE